MRHLNIGPRCAALSFLALSASFVFADDTTPPPWRNANSSWTVQEWDFNTPNVPLAPDGGTWGSGGGGFVNPNGTPLLTGVGGSAWSGSLNNRFGMWTFVGPNQLIDFQIPNSVNPNNAKDIWIQLSFFAGGSTLTPDVLYSASSGSGTAALASSGIMPDGWTHSVYTVHLNSQPATERITLQNLTPVPMQIDEVVIDTLCAPVPEPATFVAFGLGAALVLRRCVRGRVKNRS